MILFIYHFFFALVLFFLFNWVGKKSYPLGYTNFSIFDNRNESVSLNVVLKIFGPLVFLIILSAILEYLNAKYLIINIYQVIIIYVLLRILSIFIYERVSIANWWIIIPQHLTLILLSYLFYDKFINTVDSILPNFSDIKNEIWLMIIIYLYTIFNNPKVKKEEITHSFVKEIKPHKKKYVLNKYDKLKLKYSNIVNTHSPKNENFKIAIYSIMIYENFNRPYLIRKIENILCFLTKKNISQGIMQVKSRAVLNDKDSLKIGIKNLRKVRDKVIYQGNYQLEDYERIIKAQCPDDEYIYEIFYLIKIIFENRFSVFKNNNNLYQQSLNKLGVNSDYIDLYKLENNFSNNEIVHKLEEILYNSENSDDYFNLEDENYIKQLIEEYKTTDNGV